MADHSERARVSTFKKLIFSGVMLVFALCGVELIIRVTGFAETCAVPFRHPNRVCDPILYFKNAPEMRVHGQPLNHQGFRTHEFSRKPAGIYRILSLGDSCTIGVFADEKGVGYVREPYPARLESLVSRRIGRGRVEVFNLGVGGYNSFQGLMLLRSRLSGSAPDLVTVRFGWNDHFMSSLGRDERAFRESDSRLALALQDLLLRTHFYGFFRRFAMELQAGRRAEEPFAPPKEWKPNLSIDEYKRNLARIAEVVHAQGGEVWFLTSPHAFVTSEYRGKYESYAESSTAKRALAFNALQSYRRFAEIHDSYNEATRRAGMQIGVPVVDMVPVYEAHADEHLFSSIDAMHPLQPGHDLEAEALFERLVERGIIR
jgi:lysophospholipase L1-like esterase